MPEPEAFRSQVACLGGVEWCARVLDASGNVVYIEAGFRYRDTAEKVARTVAESLPFALWIDVRPDPKAAGG